MYSTFFAVIQVSIGEIDRNSLKAKIMKPLFGLISFVLGCLWDWTRCFILSFGGKEHF